MLFVFVERGGADAMQLAARQRRLEQVGSVHRAVGFAGADDGVHLVNEQDVRARRGGDLLQHGLEPLLEFAAVFRAGDERAHIERQKLLVFQALRHVAVDDAQRQTLDDRRLADARLADQHRIVLGPARQDLNGATDFLVAADHRVELAIAGGLGEIARVFLQRLIGVFRRCGIGGAALAQCFDGGVEVLRRHAGLGENLSRLAAAFQSEREQKPFDGDEAVARLLARLLGGVEHTRQRRVEINLPGAAARNFGALGEQRFDGRQCLPRIAAGPVDQTGGEPFGVVEQHLEQVFRGKLLVSLAQCERLGGLNETAAAVGVFVEIHVPSLGLSQTPFTARSEHRHGVV